MKKLSIRQLIPLIRLSKRHKPEKKLIETMKERAKKDPVVIKKFKEYDVSLDDIDKVHIEFCPLDVSAKTKNKKIYINESMLDDDSDVKDPTHYLIHELTHYLQQSQNKMKGHDVSEYLEKPTEEEAFKAQIDFKKRNESPEEAEKYTEDLLSHHNYTGKKREKKKEELLDEE